MLQHWHLKTHPILFALTTQLFLDYLNHDQTHSCMNGIQITNDLFVCKCLFANDIDILIPKTKLCFLEVEACI